MGKYLPEDINPDLCTHITYGFAVLDYENLIVKAHDSWADFDNSESTITGNLYICEIYILRVNIKSYKVGNESRPF